MVEKWLNKGGPRERGQSLATELAYRKGCSLDVGE